MPGLIYCVFNRHCFLFLKEGAYKARASPFFVVTMYGALCPTKGIALVRGEFTDDARRADHRTGRILHLLVGEMTNPDPDVFRPP